MDEPLEKALLEPGMIDSHFHSLEIASEGLDIEQILDWASARGLRHAIDVAVSLDDFERRRSLTARFPLVHYTAGVYPSEANRYSASPTEGERMMEVLERQCHEERVVAIGEIGMDGYREYASFDSQQELFRAQLALAARQRLPVVIHSREAEGPILEALKSVRVERGGVMHCFSSTYAFAKQFIDLGFLISFAGNVTFKNAEAIAETARRVPDDALLVETDAPYLAPVPVRGRVNHPGYIGHTYTFVARLRDTSVHELCAQVASNFGRMFRL